jgi:hypothetical protein
MKASNRWQYMQHWAAEPFVRFMVLGALIFAVHAAVATRSAGGQRHISVSAADVDRLRAMAVKQWGREPGPEQTSELIRAFVREEVLVREAVASGLDRDDGVWRRRWNSWRRKACADRRMPSCRPTSRPTPPTTHSPRPSRCRSSRSAVAFGVTPPRPTLRAHWPHCAPASRFAVMAPCLMAICAARPRQRWHDLGLRLVRVNARAPGGVAPFDEVRDRVRADAVNQRVTQAREAAYARALARYTVSVSNEYRQVIAAKLPLEPQP